MNTISKYENLSSSSISSSEEYPQGSLNVSSNQGIQTKVKMRKQLGSSNVSVNIQKSKPNGTLNFPGNSFVICLKMEAIPKANEEESIVYDCVLCFQTSQKYTLDEINLHGGSKNHLLRILELISPTEYESFTKRQNTTVDDILKSLQVLSGDLDKDGMATSSPSTYLIVRENVSQRIFNLKKKKNVKTAISFGKKSDDKPTSSKISISSPNEGRGTITSLKIDGKIKPETKSPKTSVDAKSKPKSNVNKKGNVFKLNNSEYDFNLEKNEKKVFLKYKKELNDLAMLQKGRQPKKVILVTDERDIFKGKALKAEKRRFQIVMKKNLCLWNTFDYLKNIQDFGKGVLYIILCGINDINREATHPSCLINNCPFPCTILSPYPMNLDLIRRALDLHFLILNHTENDIVLFAGLIPNKPDYFNKYSFQTRNCLKLHEAAAYRRVNSYKKNSLFLYSQFAKLHSKVLGFAPLELENQFLNKVNKNVNFNLDANLLNGYHFAEHVALRRRYIMRLKCVQYKKELERRYQLPEESRSKGSNKQGSSPVNNQPPAKENHSNKTNILRDENRTQGVANIRVSKYDKIAVLGNSQYNYYLEQIRGPNVSVMTDDILICDLIDYIEVKKKVMPPKTLWILVTGIIFLFCRTSNEICTFHMCQRPLYTVQPAEEVCTMNKARIMIETVMSDLKDIASNVNKILDLESDFLVFPPIPPAMIVSLFEHQHLHDVFSENPRSYIVNREDGEYLNVLFQELSINFMNLALPSLRDLGISCEHLMDYIEQKFDQIDIIDPHGSSSPNSLKFFRKWCSTFRKTAASALDVLIDTSTPCLPSRIVLYGSDDEDGDANIQKPFKSRTVFYEHDFPSNSVPSKDTKCEDESILKKNLHDYSYVYKASKPNFREEESSGNLTRDTKVGNSLNQSTSKLTFSKPKESTFAQKTISSTDSLNFKCEKFNVKIESSSKSPKLTFVKKSFHKQTENKVVDKTPEITKNNFSTSIAKVSQVKSSASSSKEPVSSYKDLKLVEKNAGSLKNSSFDSKLKKSSIVTDDSHKIVQEKTSKIKMKISHPLSKTDRIRKKYEVFTNISTYNRPVSFNVQPDIEYLKSSKAVDDSASDDENYDSVCKLDISDEIPDDDFSEEILKDLVGDDLLDIDDDDSGQTEDSEKIVHENEQKSNEGSIHSTDSVYESEQKSNKENISGSDSVHESEQKSNERSISDSDSLREREQKSNVESILCSDSVHESEQKLNEGSIPCSDSLHESEQKSKERNIPCSYSLHENEQKSNKESIISSDSVHECEQKSNERSIPCSDPLHESEQKSNKGSILSTDSVHESEQKSYEGNIHCSDSVHESEQKSKEGSISCSDSFEEKISIIYEASENRVSEVKPACSKLLSHQTLKNKLNNKDTNLLLTSESSHVDFIDLTDDAFNMELKPVSSKQCNGKKDFEVKDISKSISSAQDKFQKDQVVLVSETLKIKTKTGNNLNSQLTSYDSANSQMGKEELKTEKKSKVFSIPKVTKCRVNVSHKMYNNAIIIGSKYVSNIFNEKFNKKCLIWNLEFPLNWVEIENNISALTPGASYLFIIVGDISLFNHENVFSICLKSKCKKQATFHTYDFSWNSLLNQRIKTIKLLMEKLKDTSPITSRVIVMPLLPRKCLQSPPNPNEFLHEWIHTVASHSFQPCLLDGVVTVWNEEAKQLKINWQNLIHSDLRKDSLSTWLEKFSNKCTSAICWSFKVGLDYPFVSRNLWIEYISNVLDKFCLADSDKVFQQPCSKKIEINTYLSINEKHILTPVKAKKAEILSDIEEMNAPCGSKQMKTPVETEKLEKHKVQIDRVCTPETIDLENFMQEVDDDDEYLISDELEREILEAEDDMGDDEKNQIIEDLNVSIEDFGLKNQNEISETKELNYDRKSGNQVLNVISFVAIETEIENKQTKVNIEKSVKLIDIDKQHVSDEQHVLKERRLKISAASDVEKEIGLELSVEKKKQISLLTDIPKNLTQKNHPFVNLISNSTENDIERLSASNLEKEINIDDCVRTDLASNCIKNKKDQAKTHDQYNFETLVSETIVEKPLLPEESQSSIIIDKLSHNKIKETSNSLDIVDIVNSDSISESNNLNDESLLVSDKEENVVPLVCVKDNLLQNQQQLNEDKEIHSFLQIEKHSNQLLTKDDMSNDTTFLESTCEISKDQVSISNVINNIEKKILLADTEQSSFKGERRAKDVEESDMKGKQITKMSVNEVGNLQTSCYSSSLSENFSHNINTTSIISNISALTSENDKISLTTNEESMAELNENENVIALNSSEIQLVNKVSLTDQKLANETLAYGDENTKGSLKYESANVCNEKINDLNSDSFLNNDERNEQISNISFSSISSKVGESDIRSFSEHLVNNNACSLSKDKSSLQVDNEVSINNDKQKDELANQPAEQKYPFESDTSLPGTVKLAIKSQMIKKGQVVKLIIENNNPTKIDQQLKEITLTENIEDMMEFSVADNFNSKIKYNLCQEEAQIMTETSFQMFPNKDDSCVENGSSQEQIVKPNKIDNALMSKNIIINDEGQGCQMTIAEKRSSNQTPIQDNLNQNCVSQTLTLSRKETPTKGIEILSEHGIDKNLLYDKIGIVNPDAEKVKPDGESDKIFSVINSSVYKCYSNEDKSFLQSDDANEIIANPSIENFCKSLTEIESISKIASLEEDSLDDDDIEQALAKAESDMCMSDDDELAAAYKNIDTVYEDDNAEKQLISDKLVDEKDADKVFLMDKNIGKEKLMETNITVDEQSGYSNEAIKFQLLDDCHEVKDQLKDENKPLEVISDEENIITLLPVDGNNTDVAKNLLMDDCNAFKDHLSNENELVKEKHGIAELLVQGHDAAKKEQSDVKNIVENRLEMKQYNKDIFNKENIVDNRLIDESNIVKDRSVNGYDLEVLSECDGDKVQTIDANDILKIYSVIEKDAVEDQLEERINAEYQSLNENTHEIMPVNNVTYQSEDGRNAAEDQSESKRNAIKDQSENVNNNLQSVNKYESVEVQVVNDINDIEDVLHSQEADYGTIDNCSMITSNDKINDSLIDDCDNVNAIDIKNFCEDNELILDCVLTTKVKNTIDVQCHNTGEAYENNRNTDTVCYINSNTNVCCKNSSLILNSNIDETLNKGDTYSVGHVNESASVLQTCIHVDADVHLDKIFKENAKQIMANKLTDKKNESLSLDKDIDHQRENEMTENTLQTLRKQDDVVLEHKSINKNYILESISLQEHSVEIAEAVVSENDKILSDNDKLSEDFINIKYEKDNFEDHSVNEREEKLSHSILIEDDSISKEVSILDVREKTAPKYLAQVEETFANDELANEFTNCNSKEKESANDVVVKSDICRSEDIVLNELFLEAKEVKDDDFQTISKRAHPEDNILIDEITVKAYKNKIREVECSTKAVNYDKKCSQPEAVSITNELALHKNIVHFNLIPDVNAIKSQENISELNKEQSANDTVVNAKKIPVQKTDLQDIQGKDMQNVSLKKFEDNFNSSLQETSKHEKDVFEVFNKENSMNDYKTAEQVSTGNNSCINRYQITNDGIKKKLPEIFEIENSVSNNSSIEMESIAPIVRHDHIVIDSTVISPSILNLIAPANESIISKENQPRETMSANENDSKKDKSSFQGGAVQNKSLTLVKEKTGIPIIMMPVEENCISENISLLETPKEFPEGDIVSKDDLAKVFANIESEDENNEGDVVNEVNELIIKRNSNDKDFISQSESVVTVTLLPEIEENPSTDGIYNLAAYHTEEKENKTVDEITYLGKLIQNEDLDLEINKNILPSNANLEKDSVIEEVVKCSENSRSIAVKPVTVSDISSESDKELVGKQVNEFITKNLFIGENLASSCSSQILIESRDDLCPYPDIITLSKSAQPGIDDMNKEELEIESVENKKENVCVLDCVRTENTSVAVETDRKNLQEGIIENTESKEDKLEDRICPLDDDSGKDRSFILNESEEENVDINKLITNKDDKSSHKSVFGHEMKDHNKGTSLIPMKSCSLASVATNYDCLSESDYEQFDDIITNDLSLEEYKLPTQCNEKILQQDQLAVHHIPFQGDDDSNIEFYTFDTSEECKSSSQEKNKEISQNVLGESASINETHIENVAAINDIERETNKESHKIRDSPNINTQINDQNEPDARGAEIQRMVNTLSQSFTAKEKLQNENSNEQTVDAVSISVPIPELISQPLNFLNEQKHLKDTTLEITNISITNQFDTNNLNEVNVSIQNISLTDDQQGIAEIKSSKQTVKELLSASQVEDEIQVLEKEKTIVSLAESDSKGDFSDGTSLNLQLTNMKTMKIGDEEVVTDFPKFQACFDHVYIIGQCNPFSEKTMKTLKYTFIKHDLSSLEMSNVDNVIKTMEPIIPNSVCVVLFNFSVITKAHSSSKTLLPRSFRNEIFVHVLKNSPEISVDSGKQFITRRITTIIKIVEKISEQMQVVAIPLEPARIYAQYNFDLNESHQSSTESYYVYGPSYKWSQYRSHLVQEWNRLLETNDKLINLSCLRNFNKLAENIFPLKKHGLNGVNIVDIRQSWKQSVNEALLMMCVKKIQNTVISRDNEEKSNDSLDKDKLKDEESPHSSDQKLKRCMVIITNVTSSVPNGFFADLGKKVDRETIIQFKKDKVEMSFKSPRKGELFSELVNGLFIGDTILKTKLTEEGNPSKFSASEKSEMKVKLHSVVLAWKEEVMENLQKQLLQGLNFTCYKTVRCSKEICDKMHCIFYHSEVDMRRNPLSVPYGVKQCTNCRFGFTCTYCHNLFEQMFHPINMFVHPCPNLVSREECFKKHPLCIFCHKDSPDSFFTNYWNDLIIFGTHFAFQYLSGAIRRFCLTNPVSANCRIFMMGASNNFLNNLQKTVDPICRIHSLPHTFIGERDIFFECEPLLFGKPSQFLNYIERISLLTYTVVIVSQVDDIMANKQEKKALVQFFKRCKYSNSQQPPFVQKLFVADSPDSNFYLKSKLEGALGIRIKEGTESQPIIPFKYDVPYSPMSEVPHWWTAIKHQRQFFPFLTPTEKKEPSSTWFKRDELSDLSDSVGFSSEDNENSSEASANRKRKKLSGKSRSPDPNSSKRRKESELDTSLLSEEDEPRNRLSNPPRRSSASGSTAVVGSKRNRSRSKSSGKSSKKICSSKEMFYSEKKTLFKSQSSSIRSRSRESGSRSPRWKRSSKRSISKSRNSRTRSSLKREKSSSSPTPPKAVGSALLVPYCNSNSPSPERLPSKNRKGRSNADLSSPSSVTSMSDSEKKSKVSNKNNKGNEPTLSKKQMVPSSILLKVASSCYNEKSIRKQLGKKLFKDFERSQKEVCLKVKEEFEVYWTMPDLYDKYEEFYESFMEKYILKYPNNDEDHKDCLWTEFWKSQFDYVRKCELEHRIKLLIKDYQSKITPVHYSVPLLSNPASNSIRNPIAFSVSPAAPFPSLSTFVSTHFPLPSPSSTFVPTPCPPPQTISYSTSTTSAHAPVSYTLALSSRYATTSAISPFPPPIFSSVLESVSLPVSSPVPIPSIYNTSPALNPLPSTVPTPVPSPYLSVPSVQSCISMSAFLKETQSNSSTNTIEKEMKILKNKKNESNSKAVQSLPNVKSHHDGKRYEQIGTSKVQFNERCTQFEYKNSKLGVKQSKFIVEKTKETSVSSKHRSSQSSSAFSRHKKSPTKKVISEKKKPFASSLHKKSEMASSSKSSSSKKVSLHKTSAKAIAATKEEQSPRIEKKHKSKNVISESKESKFDVNKALGLLELMVPDLGVLGHSITSMLSKAEKLGKITSDALKVFTVSDNIALVEMALNKIKSKYNSEDKVKFSNYIDKIIRDFLKYAQETQNEEPCLNVEAIAIATMGKDTVFVLNMIRAVAAYEGLELSNDEVNKLFMEVCAVHLKNSLKD